MSGPVLCPACNAQECGQEADRQTFRLRDPVLVPMDWQTAVGGETTYTCPRCGYGEILRPIGAGGP